MKSRNAISVKSGSSNQIKINQNLRISDLEENFAKNSYSGIIGAYFNGVKTDKQMSYQKSLSVVPVQVGERFKYPENTKKPIKKLLNWLRDKYKIPDSVVTNINLIYNMRCAPTIITPPDYNVAGRFILNYHDSDMYHMESPEMISKNDITNFGISEYDQYLKKDTIAIMGPGQLCHYNIRTNGGIWIYISSDSGIKRKTLKPRNYARLTVVVDMIVNRKYAEILIDNSKKLGNDRISKITRQVILNMTSKYREEIERESLKIKKMLSDL